MSSSELRLDFETDIRASAERVFAILIDLHGYHRWLPRSSAYHGTTEISDDPITLGTTYVEPGPTGVRVGRVTSFDPPSRLGFDQPMTMRPRWAGVVHIRLDHVLTPTAKDVHLARTVSLSFAGPVKFARPLVKRAFVKENERMIAALTLYAERSGP